MADAEPERGIGRSEPLRGIVAAALVLLWVLLLATQQGREHRVLGLVLIAVLARATLTDIERRRIGNPLILAASLAAVAIGLALGLHGLPRQLAWGFGAGIFMFVVALAARGGLGMGDVKLSFVLGLFLSRDVVSALIVGLLAAGVFSLAMLARHGLRSGLKTAIPLGPFLALGGVVVLFSGRLIG